MTLQELAKRIGPILQSDEWEIGKDNKGQIVVYTGLKFKEEDRLETLVPLDEGPRQLELPLDYK